MNADEYDDLMDELHRLRSLEKRAGDVEGMAKVIYAAGNNFQTDESIRWSTNWKDVWPDYIAHAVRDYVMREMGGTVDHKHNKPMIHKKEKQMVKVSAGVVVGSKDGTSEVVRAYEKGTNYEVKDGSVNVLDAEGKLIATFHHFVWAEVCDKEQL